MSVPDYIPIKEGHKAAPPAREGEGVGRAGYLLKVPPGLAALEDVDRQIRETSPSVVRPAGWARKRLYPPFLK